MNVIKRTKELMDLDEIIISEKFKETPPKLEKMIRCDAEYRFNKKMDRDIVVDENNVLIDGYVLYKVLKSHGVDDVEVIREVNEVVDESYRDIPTIYVYGMHPEEGELGKERVWRVPHGLTRIIRYAPGRQVRVNTKKGVSIITITKIEFSCTCPLPKGVYVNTIIH